MSERLNRTSICSVVFLDIVNQSKKPVAEQIKDKDLFNGFINEAIKDVAESDRILLDSGDGAAIALMGAPEEALFISMTIRDSIVKYNKDNQHKLFVRTGINLGPVRVVSDINGRPNILGDGINVAERVMSFAEPNQILVSRSYYEITSRLTDEITSMFSYFGVRQDKHVREHEVYSIRSSEELPFVPEAPEPPDSTPLLSRLLKNENLSRYGLWGSAAVVLIAISAGGFMLASNMLDPDLGDVVANTAPADSAATSPQVAPAQAVVAQPTVAKAHVAAPNLVDPEAPITADAATAEQPAVPTSANDELKTETPKRKSSSRKKTEKVEAAQTVEPLETVQQPQPSRDSRSMAAAPPVESRTIRQEPGTTSGKDLKAGWDAFRESFKQGRKERVCTQAEIALNQCS